MSATFPWQIEKAKVLGYKPCPFCGGNTYIAEIGNEHGKQRCIEIGCNSCHVKRKQCVRNGSPYLSYEGLHEKMLEHWNARTAATN